jgi:hypothetical protein
MSWVFNVTITTITITTVTIATITATFTITMLINVEDRFALRRRLCYFLQMCLPLWSVRCLFHIIFLRSPHRPFLDVCQRLCSRQVMREMQLGLDHFLLPKLLIRLLLARLRV